ncbi:cobalamin-dependent protein [Candidatus Mycobacterium wuenschmannii]|uniref:Cobalamin-dependent protein n=1 Tax=Candidatus Mycobacterium wuenschmannii TaxID=3027808 RepID=A0ABY8VU23_9MYCO|nr:cobalamin-dependent protein [Candidatus Mycobacterium wuenschmannii]WIM87118.1 cobalamin-dependent protein [Candidatus Mycobacterium wuenschmannii]
MSAPDVDTASARGIGTDQALVREKLWGAVADSDEYAAVTTIFAAADAGMPPEEILLDVIARVQYKIGTEWAANRITVAQEHAATAINDRVIAALAQHPASRSTAQAGRVTVACVDGEWHALPARLLSETLRLRGWQVDFLGAQVPTPHLIAHLHQSGPDAVALSCSIPTGLPTAHAAITACQAAGVAVLAGGAAFGFDGRYARQLGADAWAPDARAAADLLAEGFLCTHLASNRQPVDDLPHLIDQEYTTVSQTATQLVKETFAALEDRIPAMRDYTEQQRQRTAEDIAHVVDFLIAGLYTDDDELFSGFIAWTADILTARGVPAATLFPTLDLVGKQLIEFPRSQRLLAAAHTALADKKSSATDPPTHT